MISIIVPAFNEEKELPQTLQQIISSVANFKLQNQGETEIIVVDNASQDNTAQIAKSFGARVVREEKRQIARARNTGAKFARGEILLFCDADSHLHPQTLLAIAKLLENPNLIGGGIRILPDESCPSPTGNSSYDWLFGRWGMTFLCKVGLFFWDRFSKIFKISGGTLFLRREVFKEVGGFSEKFYIGEEVILQMKMKWYAFRQKKRMVLLKECPVKTSMRKIREYGLLRYSWAVLRCLFFPFFAMQKKYCSLWYDVRSGKEFFRPAPERSLNAELPESRVAPR